MRKYVETIDVGSTTTSTLFVKSGPGATFSWAMAMPEGDPLAEMIVTEADEHKERFSALLNAAAKKKRKAD